MKSIPFGIMVLTLLVACSKEPQPTELVFDLAAGKAIAETQCADCHGMDGQGVGAHIPNLTGQPAQYLIDALHAYRDGGRLHAALQDMASDMSEADMANIAGYYASQSPPEPANDQPSDQPSYQKGATVASLCEVCHGEKGISTTEGVPNLVGQQPAYLITATLKYQNGTRTHQDMGDMLLEIEQVDIEKMAMYFASQSAPLRKPPSFGDPIAGKADSAVCGKCHGRSGISHDPLIPSLAGQEPVYLVNAIKAYHNLERSSEAQMPVMSDEQIENIAAYYSIQPIEASVEGQLSGAELAAKCDRCHNPASGNRKLNVPILRGQSHDYLVKAMKEYRNDDRSNSMMHKMSARYSDEMIEELATYYASQQN